MLPDQLETIVRKEISRLMNSGGIDREQVEDINNGHETLEFQVTFAVAVTNIANDLADKASRTSRGKELFNNLMKF